MGEELEKPKSNKKGAIIAVVALGLVIAAAVVAYQALPNLSTGVSYELSLDGAINQEDTDRLMACEIEKFDGTKLTFGDLSEASGKPIVINMWASWCENCEEEMEAYNKLSGEYGDRLEFVMLDLPNTIGERDAAREYLKEHGFTFPAYYDTDMKTATVLNVVGIPVLVIITPEGKVVLNHAGISDYDTLKGTFDNVLKLN